MLSTVRKIFSGSRIEIVLKVLLVVALSVGSFSQLENGLADNGDYTRVMTWISSGPVGFSKNWPPSGTTDYQERFFNYWLPYWTLDFPLASRWVTSVLLLWIPGVLLNMVLISPSVLWLPMLSIAPRFLSIVLLLALFRWIDRHASSYRSLLYLTLCFPYILIAIDKDYLAYFSTFYQEPASIVFILWLVTVFIAYRRKNTRAIHVVTLGALVFLVTEAKFSNIYWPLLAGAVTYFFFLRNMPRKRAVAYMTLIVLLPFTISFLQSSLVGSRYANAYQSLYCGVFVFSDRPQDHLARLGLEGTEECFDIPAYTPLGEACIDRHRDKMSHINTVSVIIHEPIIALRMLRFAADSMQRANIWYLGKNVLRNFDGQRIQAGPPAAIPILSHLKSAWSEAKRRWFPRGDLLLVALLIFAIVFSWNVRSRNALVSDLALAGLIFTVASPVDLWIQIFGDGKYEVIKHLLIPNMTFDLALVAFVNILLLSMITFINQRRYSTGLIRETPTGGNSER